MNNTMNDTPEYTNANPYEVDELMGKGSPRGRRTHNYRYTQAHLMPNKRVIELLLLKAQYFLSCEFDSDKRVPGTISPEIIKAVLRNVERALGMRTVDAEALLREHGKGIKFKR